MKTIIKNIDVDKYISSFPEEVQILLEQVRSIVRQSAPEAEEVISYQMPAFKYHGILVYYAAWKNHIGFYPTGTAISYFQNELSDYSCAKGSIQFPYSKPLPEELISRIVKHRVSENIFKAELKKSTRTCKNGHKFHKTSDCPTCPICEKESKPKNGFMALISAPARRALVSKGILSLESISKYTETEILALHGMGKSTIPKLRTELKKMGLDFKK